MINSHKVTKHACTSSWLPLAHSKHHHIPSSYSNEQTTKETKAINNSYIYIYIYIYTSHVNVTQTVPDISPLMPMHQDPLLVDIWAENRIFEPRTRFSTNSWKPSKHVQLVFSGCFMFFLALFDIWADNRIFEPRTVFSKHFLKASKNV